MAFFGKDEGELKVWQNELEKREKELNELKATLESASSDLENRKNLLKTKSEKLAELDAEICAREEDLAQRELNAKNSFVSQQRAAFKEAIEVQIKELDLRAQELTDIEANLDKRMESVQKIEGELANRARALKEKELSAENGFAEKNLAALKEIEVREQLCVDRETALEKREQELVNKTREFQKQSETLRSRENSIRESEFARDEGYADERSKLESELTEKRENFAAEQRKLKEQKLAELSQELANERKTKLHQLESDLAKIREESLEKISSAEKDAKLAREQLLKNQAELEDEKEGFQFTKDRLQSRIERLAEREDNLEQEVDQRVQERQKSFEKEKAGLLEEISRLRESITASNKLVSNFEQLSRKLNDDDPAAVLLRLKTYEEEIRRLRDDLASRPTMEMQDAFDRLKSQEDDLRASLNQQEQENIKLRRSVKSQSSLENQIEELVDKNRSLQLRYEAVDADNSRLQDELRRMQASYEREQDREQRIQDIEAPYFAELQPRAAILESEIKHFRTLIGSKERGDELAPHQLDELSRLGKDVTSAEIEWLNKISDSCLEYGLRFPKRILYAFHTALKTSEWSPVTVLAGVSGTGKSELPRLYSHFGGVNFLSLSVQPNWDSQESMLGFFNSIDNKFDAQPVLQLLAQSQKPISDDYPFGLQDTVCLVLMDEMNLAHVELYFAEFLSKLELRRGCKGNEVPNLEVKLGAGIKHYPLPLGRNVLWVGTMNQDETTKSLSDKVLDRGTVINFPRPTTLERRRQLKPLGDKSPLLSRKLWESWWCRESQFTDSQIAPYKRFIEEMNEALSKVGRALGHRVWQSIEYYMANYPDVLIAQRNLDDAALSRAMKIAFEDQLVQKVMPKLRGIETRGKSKTECLDRIREQLERDDYSILEDFDWACSEINYGQFIWSSANYLRDEDSTVADQNAQEEHSDESRAENAEKTESVNGIPQKLLDLASQLSKEIWELTTAEIKSEMSCDALTAKHLKESCNNMLRAD